MINIIVEFMPLDRETGVFAEIKMNVYIKTFRYFIYYLLYFSGPPNSCFEHPRPICLALWFQSNTVVEVHEDDIHPNCSGLHKNTFLRDVYHSQLYFQDIHPLVFVLCLIQYLREM